MPRALLIGEDNPYGHDPRLALFPYPKRSAGYRLCCKVLGLDGIGGRGTYLREYYRVNLCSSRWSLKRAREMTKDLMMVYEDGLPFVLLGSKVCQAFGVTYEPFTIRELEVSGVPGRRKKICILPHPSGRCHEWNKEGSYEKAREALRKVGIP